jgi:hypothetical protein
MSGRSLPIVRAKVAQASQPVQLLTVNHVWQVGRGKAPPRRGDTGKQFSASLSISYRATSSLSDQNALEIKE